MRIVIALAFILFAWKWGDWKNWKKYEATILFFIIGVLLYNFMLHDYRMWEYTPDRIFPNHTFVELLNTFVDFPCIFLVFLPHIPKSFLNKILYVLLWGAILSALEWIMYELGKINYHHGWNYWISAIFYFFVSFIITLHYKKRLLAYAISVVVVVSLMIIFRVPANSIK